MTLNKVVVVGGGILGTMHALFALRSNASVVHLDRDEVPNGASVRNFGLCWVSGRAPGAELALALAPANSGARSATTCPASVSGRTDR